MANATQPTDADPRAFCEAVAHPGRRADALRLLDLFAQTTGFAARMWGPSLVGFGRYRYTYATGRTGDWLATGFSPRRANMVVYIMPGYADFGEILARLGPHRLGKSCLYLGRLAQIEEAVLAELIRAGLDELATHWPVEPS
ncbi:DUF1801 domain-containing protein [Vannielia litorea]|uniref:YdhG-like domain-containing protein n=1 Tax=Vannielia litorea TaxID=1217970 RepID=A0A1N6GS27_9RHOB|nr:DUF1801 domain-containing protein [Vannielia litorea]SIO10364.1 protein of unknown function (DU1801) [Vannielia litorea]